jgi:amino acid adenylation domain-containing protein
VCGEAYLTFGALAARTARLAAQLRRHGVAPERRVALVVDRSAELAIGALAILEAGGAFVAIDPRVGADRIRALARAAGADLFVAGRALRRGLGEAAATVVVIDDGDDPPVPLPPPPAHPLADDPARLLYVMHTSGSTAAPRAVEVEHASVVDQVRSLARDLGLGPADRHLHTASLGFTLAVRQLLLPICLGGAVVIARDHELRDPLALLRAAGRAGATVLDLVPSLLRTLVAALRGLPARERDAVVPDRLRLVLTAGERLPAELVAGWWSVAGRAARVINLYGASEVGGSVAWHEVRQADLDRGSIPIGRARSGTTIELFDPAQRSLAPVSPGTIGELCVAGPAVARGYARPYTGGRAAFVDGAQASSDPAGERVAGPARGVRWFRTGDLARRGGDGALELVGRLDDEVKIRGVRVLPEIVEEVLRGEPGVRDVAVVPGGEPPLLVAYLVGAELPPDPVLRERVRAALPAAFVPAAFIRAAELPRLASGKLDRRALCARARDAGATGAALASELEQQVARAWQVVLGISPRSADADFFALGGSSLVAVQLAEQLGDDVPGSLVFDRPTLGEQAAWLAERPDRQLARPRLAPGDRGGRAALSFAQERLWLAEVLAPGQPGPRVHRALHLTGPLDEPRLEAALRAVAARHAALRTTFAAAGDGLPYQVVHAGLPRDHATLDLTTCADDERAAALARHRAVERCHPFELERGPLWRTRLLRLAPERHVLLLTIHHLVTDGWSMQRWQDEVSACYAAPPGARPDVPALVVQPAAVAEWQRRCLASGAYDGARAYWRARLAGLGARRELPHDGPRHEHAGAWRQAVVDRAVTSALRELARAEGGTLFVVLVAALACVVAELTGDRDVTIGALVAGRDRPELRPLIGLFLNTLPLRVQVERAGGLRAALASAREATLGALAHAELPFERIVADLNPPRQAARNPLFDVALNYQPPAALATLGDLALTVLDPEPEIAAPFDAMWRVVERDGELQIRVEYRRARFAAGRIAAWLARFVELLARGAAAA